MDTNNSNPSSTPSPRPHRPSRWPLFFIVVVAAIIAFTYFNRSEITEPDTPAIEWIHDYSAGFDLARKENKPVLLAFHADWCPSCNQMKRTTYHDPEVIKTVAKFIPVMVDTDRQKDLADRYGIQGIPAYVVTDKSGAVVHRFAGPSPSAEFIKLLDAGLEKIHP